MKGTKILSDIKFYNDYSKYDEVLDRKQTWEEKVEMVMDMHRQNPKFKSAFENPQFVGFFDEAVEAYKDKLVLASQRSLQFSGKPIMKHNAKMYNCTVSYCDRSRVFQEAMYMLLCGCGVGMSFMKEHVVKMPTISKRTNGTKTYVIEDSIEGWADAVGVLMSSYFDSDHTFPEYENSVVHFDYSQIRPKGALISGGFKAPGPDGLKQSLERIETLMEGVVTDAPAKWRPIVAYDVLMHCSDAVLSGGVRRSATIALFSHDDEEMMNAKTGDWLGENPQRARSNNSVVLIKDQIERLAFDEIFKATKEFGEPGFVFSESHEVVYNPCVTKDTTVLTSDGVRTVEELIGKEFKAVVDGKEYDTLSEGFWKTGVKQVYELSTLEGNKLRLTDNHKLLCVNNDGNEEWVELKDIEIGGKIKLNRHTDYSWGGDDEKDTQRGWLLGSLVGDGTFDDTSAILRYWGGDDSVKEQAVSYLNDNYKKAKTLVGTTYKDILSIYSSGLAEEASEYGIIRNDKTPNVELERESSNFLIGYLRGLFDADGSMQGTQIKGGSVRLTQVNLEILEQVQRILLRLGINTTIYKNRRDAGWYSLPDGKGGMADYYCKAVHELIISKVNIITFNDRVGFSVTEKQNKLSKFISNYKRKPNKDNFTVTVASIIEDGIEDVYDVTVDEVHRFDANGIVAHNCVEIGMVPRTEDGRSGWQVCNLTEINGGKCDDAETFYKACVASAFIGTLQASYTDFRYLTPESKEICDREALIGCSITGFMNNPKILFDPEILENGANMIKEINAVISKMIGINKAARTTCVKPSGNASVLLETTSGIHGDHSKNYFRIMQINKEEEIAQYLNNKYPDLIEDSVWSSTNADYALFVPIKADKKTRLKEDLLGVKQLEYVKLVQQHWVETGTNENLCLIPEVRHNVSNTITVDNWEEVQEYIWENKKWFSGISLLSHHGDKVFNQAPFTEVLQVDEIIDKYGHASMFVSGLIVDALHLFDNNLWKACDYLVNSELPIEGTRQSVLLKKDWISKAKKFGKKHYQDVQELTFCMKDVHLAHKWMKTSRSIGNLDVAPILEKIKPEYVEVNKFSAVACSGGSCEITYL